MGVSLRLGEVLEECRKKANRSYLGLAQDIRSAYEKATGGRVIRAPVDRRKLKRIVEKDPELTLSLKELEALDAYLAPNNEGLAEKPLLRREGILQALARQRVTFFVGARYQEKPYARQYLSVWDVQAYSALQDGLNAARLNTRLELKTVGQTDPDQEMLRGQLQDLGPDAAVCSIGAPRSCPMTELMLSVMFGIGVEAFRPLPSRSPTVPFYFVYPPEHQVHSAFVLTCDQLKDEQGRRQVKRGEAWAFLPPASEARFLRWKDNPFDDYGVIAAQRRPEGQLWLVLAGLSGPGTRAAAQSLLRDLESRTPRVPEPPEVLYAVVHARVAVSEGQDASGDRRDLQAHELLLGPEYLSPAGRSSANLRV